MGVVLVVEDDPDLRDLLKAVLERSDDSWTVVVAGSLSEIDWSEDPEVAVVDYMLPGATGAEVARRIRLIWPDCRIVGWSASSSADTGFNGLVDAMLYKPVDTALLVRTIHGG